MCANHYQRNMWLKSKYSIVPLCHFGSKYHWQTCADPYYHIIISCLFDLAEVDKGTHARITSNSLSAPRGWNGWWSSATEIVSEFHWKEQLYRLRKERFDLKMQILKVAVHKWVRGMLKHQFLCLIVLIACSEVYLMDYKRSFFPQVLQSSNAWNKTMSGTQSDQQT